MRHALRGHCPACGLQQLAVNRTGVVVCCNLDCTRPTALDELLANPETDHVVQLARDDFVLEHPLIERLDGGLFSCRLTGEIAEDGPTEPPGRYHAYPSPIGPVLIPIEGDHA